MADIDHSSLRNRQTLEAYKRRAIKEARESLMGFTLYTNPQYETGWFNELLSAELDNFLVEAEQGLMPRLMIFAPPRSGKSEKASRRFPAYVLGKHPNWNVIACSYSSDLANRMSRDTQRIIDSDRYKEVFPNVRLNGSNIRTVAGGAIRTAELWETLSADGRLPADVIAMGCAGLATVGLSVISASSPDVARQLRDRLMSTVDIVITHEGTRQQRKVNGALDFEEVSTIRKLLDKVFQVNFDFLTIAGE